MTEWSVTGQILYHSHPQTPCARVNLDARLAARTCVAITGTRAQLMVCGDLRLLECIRTFQASLLMRT